MPKAIRRTKENEDSTPLLEATDVVRVGAVLF